jgi:hypothetical protein
MIVRFWPCMVIGALLLSNMGCKGSNETSAVSNSKGVVGGKTSDSRGNLLPVQSSHTTGSVISNGKDLQKLLATYEEDLTHLAGRVQASADDRWYATAHKYNMDIQINFDLKYFMNDVDTLVKSDLPPSAVSVRIREQSVKLQQDTARLSEAVQAYLDQTTPAGREQWLTAIRQNVEITRKQLLVIKKLSAAPASTTAKI